MKQIKSYLVPVLVLAGVITLIAYTLTKNTNKANDEIKAEQKEVPFIVNAMYAKYSGQQKGIPFHGQVEPRNTFTLYSEAEGKVIQSDIILGNKVNKGQNILSIDASLRSANKNILEQNIRKAQLDYDIAKKNFIRYKNLLQNGNTSTAEYENVKAQFDAAEVQLKVGEQQLQTAKIQVSQTKVIAPSAGVIVEKKVNQGDYVQPGTPLGTLIDNVLIVKCFVPDYVYLQAKKGQQVKILADAFPEKPILGNIQTLVPYANESKLYLIEISFSSKEELFAGNGVQVMFPNDNKSTSLLIPRTALLGDFKNPSVYIINSNKQPEKKSILLGKAIENFVEVTKGLNENDLVITNGQSNIEPGKVLSDFKIVQ
jgi:RND family efflux transporter MFP subunit